MVKVSAGVWAVPSTETVTVPVGTAVLAARPEVTVIVIASVAPEAGVEVAAATAVFEATDGTVTPTDPLDDKYVVSPPYAAEIVCAPTDVEEKLYVTEPFVNVSMGACATPSTETVTLPVGVAVLDVEPEATVIVIVSLAPNVGVLVAAATVVCEATCTGAATVTVIDVLEAAYVVSPEYVAAIVCEPVTVDEKLYVAEPLVSVSVDAGVPSTETATVPVGVVVLDVEPEATVIEIASVAPEAGVVLAAISVVLEVTSVTLTTVTVTEPVEAA